ncbi:hypothetical protein [Aurantiacibacter sp. D1-12]|uniref:hypothetical protein n=1 Tax=Aurantiacibacter sp. D1-12 TaxID=2993658 RepID=UPI00237D2A21|nr:hypothetical protein [Aurantiacibacter sp. D1-12]MDE1467466.1 hypothetical protein [Aurantiacibacter sp. D1-12]
MSMLSFGAALLYMVATVACVGALGAARNSRTHRRDTKKWLACAAVFVVLAIARLTDFEELSRNALRTWAREGGAYAQREQLQLPATILVAIAGVVTAFWLLRIWQRGNMTVRSRLAFLSICASCAFAPLYGLRITSLHVTDRLLYSGPIRLNWVIDIGLTLTVLICAALYVRRSRR